ASQPFYFFLPPSPLPHYLLSIFPPCNIRLVRLSPSISVTPSLHLYLHYHRLVISTAFHHPTFSFSDLCISVFSHSPSCVLVRPVPNKYRAPQAWRVILSAQKQLHLPVSFSFSYPVSTKKPTKTQNVLIRLSKICAQRTKSNGNNHYKKHPSHCFSDFFPSVHHPSAKQTKQETISDLCFLLIPTFKFFYQLSLSSCPKLLQGYPFSNAPTKNLDFLHG
ncbi:hypothetical protein BKA57DRAFT_496629, partial [Linnemannia elongata]